MARGPALAPGKGRGARLGYVGRRRGSFLADLGSGGKPGDPRTLFGDPPVSGLELATDGAGRTTAAGVVYGRGSRASIELVRDGG